MKEKDLASGKKIQRISKRQALLIRIFFIVALAVLGLTVFFLLLNICFKIEVFGILSPILRKMLGIMGILMYSGGMGYVLSRLIRGIVGKKLTLWQEITTLAHIILVGTSIILLDVTMMSLTGWLYFSFKIWQIFLIAGAVVIFPCMIIMMIMAVSLLFSKDKKFPNLYQ